MGFFSGIVGSLFGGRQETVVQATQQSNVTVEVNPEIAVAVDLAPVAQVAEAIQEGNVVQGQALTQALGAQATAFSQGFGSLAAEVGEAGKALALVALLGVGVFAFGRR